MKILTVCLLGCAMMVLAEARILQALIDQPIQQVRNQLVKRSISCPHGWSQFNGRCFLFVPKQMSWAKAERNCQSVGANLASVHSVEEYREIQRLILSATNDNTEAWIGGSNAQELNVWLWSDGSSFSYVNWCPGQPDNLHGQQHCLKINHGGGKCWDDLECWGPRSSVCAKKHT